MSFRATDRSGIPKPLAGHYNLTKRRYANAPSPNEEQKADASPTPARPSGTDWFLTSTPAEKGQRDIPAVSDAGNFGMNALDRVEREDPFLQVRPKASSQ